MRADIGKNVGQDVSGENRYRSGWGAERVVMVNSFEFVRNSHLRLGTLLVDAKLHDARFEIIFNEQYQTLRCMGHWTQVVVVRGAHYKAGGGWSHAVSGLVCRYVFNSAYRASCE